MPDPKKPTAIEQMVEILRTLVTQPVTDQSSMNPTPGDVKRVKRAMATPKPATKKKRAATKRKTVRKTVSRKKPTARTVKRKKTARK